MTQSEMTDTQTTRRLMDWFKARLSESDLQFGDEPFSYDCNTDYDMLFYRLQQEAAEEWQTRYGFMPTPGQLMQGFFGAEYERFRQAKHESLPWMEKIKLAFNRVSRSRH